jgi:hypothetical protein
VSSPLPGRRAASRHAGRRANSARRTRRDAREFAAPLPTHKIQRRTARGPPRAASCGWHCGYGVDAMCGARNLMHKNRRADRFFRWKSSRPLAMLFRQRESAEAAVPRVRRARFLRSALLLRECGFGNGRDGLRPGMSDRLRRPASSGGLPPASGAEAAGFALSSGSYGGLREAVGGPILSGGGFRVGAVADAADVGRDTQVARERRWRGSGTGGGSSRA